MLAKIFAGVGVELQIPQLVPRPARPSAVPPRSHHQRARRSRPVLFERMEQLQRTREILGVEPSPHEQRRRMNVLHIRSERPRLPELVVIRMFQVLVPIRILVMKIFRVGIRQRPHIEIEGVRIGRPIVERKRAARTLRLRPSRFKHAVKPKVRGQIKSAVVIRIVAVPDIPHRRLRRNRRPAPDAH